MEPLRGGNLANPTATVQSIYDDFPVKRSAIDWAFRHLIDYPQVSTILSGMTTLEQLKENIEIFSQPDALPGCLTAAEHDLLQQVKLAYESVGGVPCTGCDYCMPCPNGLNIPRTFSLYNDGVRFGDFELSKRSYWFTARMGIGLEADKCTECGECEKKCPQGIEIIKELKTAHQALSGWVE
jgi:predicted aldo/keto reductase-like oxidoreductase